ncbi:MAG: winged helix-turn-helix domain-containing protein [Candidatus Woesearchaeota archaeon]
MGSRRNRNEIIYDILDALAKNNGQLKPTRLLYKANMSHSQMKEYIGELSEKSLLELVEDKSKQYYRLTNTGYEFFHNLRKIREMSDALGL